MLAANPTTKHLLGRPPRFGAPTPLATKTSQDVAWDSGAAAVKASKVIQGITVTALLFGTGGNAITVALVDGGALGLVEVGNAITVTLNTGVSTTAQVAALIAGSSTLATAAGGDGTVATAAVAVALAGGADDPILLTAGAEVADVGLSQPAYLCATSSADLPAQNGVRYTAGTHRIPVRDCTHLHYKSVAALAAVSVSTFEAK